MQARHYLLTILILAFVSVGYTQECACPDADKLRPIIGKYFNTGKLDSAAVVLNQLKNSPNTVCKIVYLDGIAQVNISKKQYAEARKYLKEEEELQIKLKCNKLLIRFYNTQSRFYQETSQLDSSSIMSVKAMEFAEQDRDWYAAARASTNLASIFHQQKQNDKAVYYNVRALTYARNSGESVILAAVLNRTANAYSIRYNATHDKKYLDSVLLFANESVSVSRGRPANLIEAPDAFAQLANYYRETKNYKRALQYADSAIQICPNGFHDFDRHLLNAYSTKSEIFFQLNNFVKARAMADSAYRYAQGFNIQLAVNPLENMFKASKALKDYEKASWAHERMTQIRDSIFTIEKNFAINELERKYTQARNERTIKELSQEKEIDRLRIQFLIIAVIAALVVIALIIFVYRLSLLKQRQQAIESKYRLRQALINPHFLSNALVSIQRFMLDNNPAEASNYLTKFSRLMRQLLEYSREEYITLAEEIDLLKNYLDLQKLRMKDGFNYKIIVSDNLSIHDVRILPMFIQPFVENAVEHGVSKVDHGEITISISEQERKLLITIQDNGPGILSATKEQQSLSTTIIQERLELINKTSEDKITLEITDNTSSSGTLVKLLLPINS